MPAQNYPEFARGQRVVSHRGVPCIVQGRDGDWSKVANRHYYLVKPLGFSWNIRLHASQIRPANQPRTVN